MKRICMLLALLLATVFCCGQALAAEGDAILGHTEDGSVYFSYGFPMGDRLFMVSYETLYAYSVGEADMTEYYYDLPVPDEDASYDISVLPFASEDRLYAIVLTTRYDGASEFVGASLDEMTLDGDAASFQAVCELDWSDMVEYYDNNSYATRPESVVGLKGQALIRYYDSTGEPAIALIDLENGKIEEVPDLRDSYSISSYRDGMLLVEQYSYSNSEVARLVAFDPADGSVQPLREIQVPTYSPLQALAYDAETDTIYCAKGGEVCPVDLASGEVGEGVTDMPIESYGSSACACVLPGSYYALCADGAAIRNLDPAQRAETKLKINDGVWSDSVNNAYYRFANAHGDVSVVLSRDFAESDSLIESMMNRDDSIDIYVVYSASTAFDALYNRGYLMELDGSEKAQALAEGMYPSLREGLSTNGHLVALPVSVSASTLGINEKALEALGMTLEDVPDSWSGFLDFLSGLEGVLTEDSGIHLFYGGYSAETARMDLFNAIFQDYQHYISAVDPAMGYDTELLRGLLAKLEQVDFAALGCPPEEEQEDEASASYVDYSDESVLLQTDIGCSIGNFYSEYTPLLLRVDPDRACSIVLETTVAIVNPFTKNPEAALAFIDELVDNLPNSTLYTISPDLSEPVRGSWNEEYLADVQEMLDGMRAELDAAEAADRQMLEESVRDMEQQVEYIDAYAWEISPREIEWYRAHDDGVIIEKVNWLYANESDSSWELLDQYREGQISAADMLKAIDKKLQMMLLEGN